MSVDQARKAQTMVRELDAVYRTLSAQGAKLSDLINDGAVPGVQRHADAIHDAAMFAKAQRDRWIVTEWEVAPKVAE